MKSTVAHFVHAVLIVLLALSAVITQSTTVQAEFSCASVTEIPSTECQALAALYTSTGGPDWTVNTNWLVTGTPSDWVGVTVEGGHVISLSLNDNQLSGSIPIELGQLNQLTELRLADNQLTGAIPGELGNLPNLQTLVLRSNQLNGSIPGELGNLTNLVDLNLRSNQLSGGIPAQLGKLVNLQTLNLRDNALVGSIPPELGNLVKLVELNLSNNQLSGSIPAKLGNLTSLTDLNLIYNQLDGSIPRELGNLKKLTNLDLSANRLSGSIPMELGNLTSLERLFLWGNQLSGSIPAKLGKLTNLVWFDLSSNHLSGSIPPELTKLVNIPNPDPQQGAQFELNWNWLTVPSPYPSTPPTVLETFLMRKNPGWEKTQGVRTYIPDSGGEAHSADGSASVTVGPGALSQPVTLKITTLTNPGAGAGSLVFANHSFNIGAYGSDGELISPFAFAKPVMLTVSYKDSDIAGQKESRLQLYFWDSASSAWKDATQTCSPASVYVRDLANNKLSVKICHLTEFALALEKTYAVVMPFVIRP